MRRSVGLRASGKKKASSGKAAKKNGATKKPKEDLGASEHKKMLQQRDAEAAFMKRLEQKEREFKLKQFAGAREFQRIRRGFAHRRRARLERDRRVGQAMLAQRITRGWLGRRYASEVNAWLDDCHRCALLRFDPFKSDVPKAKGVVVLLHGGKQAPRQLA